MINVLKIEPVAFSRTVTIPDRKDWFNEIILLCTCSENDKTKYLLCSIKDYNEQPNDLKYFMYSISEAIFISDLRKYVAQRNDYMNICQNMLKSESMYELSKVLAECFGEKTPERTDYINDTEKNVAYLQIAKAFFRIDASIRRELEQTISKLLKKELDYNTKKFDNCTFSLKFYFPLNLDAIM